jgi:hypothetical protein
MHDRNNWGPSNVVQLDHDHKVKIKKRADCGPFLSMLCKHFDVGIWSPIESTLVEVVAKFLALGIPSLKWSFLWGKETSGTKRNLNDLFSVIPVSLAPKARCLQIDCDATATAESPPSNVITCPRWDPLEPNDDYLTRLIEPFQALSRNPSDIEYCTQYLVKDVIAAATPRIPVGPWLVHGGRKYKLSPNLLLLPPLCT